MASPNPPSDSPILAPHSPLFPVRTGIGWEKRTIKGTWFPDTDYYICKRIPLEDWQIAAYYGLNKDDDEKDVSDSDEENDNKTSDEDEDSESDKENGIKDQPNLEDAMEQLVMGEKSDKEVVEQEDVPVKFKVPKTKSVKVQKEKNGTPICAETKQMFSHSTLTARSITPTRASTRLAIPPPRLCLDHEAMSQQYYNEITIGMDAKQTSTPKRGQTLVPNSFLNVSKAPIKNGSAIPVQIKSKGKAKNLENEAKKGRRCQSVQT